MTDSELEFPKVYDIFRPRVFRYLMRLVGEHDAEDLTQEVFVKVNQGLENFKGESKLSTWIYRIATNVAFDRLRSRSSQKRIPENLAGEDEIEIEDKNIWTGEQKPSAESSLIRKEMNECIRNIVENLPASYRAVIVLSEIEELKNDEIAEILGVSLDTVKIRLHRARARLKKELKAHCTFYRDERNEMACDRKPVSINPENADITFASANPPRWTKIYLTR